MTKFIKGALIIGILCIVFGMGIFFAGKVMGGGRYVKNMDFSSMLTTDSKNLKEEYATLEKTKIDDFDKINIKTNTIDIKIAQSDDKNCYIAYNLKKEKGEVPAVYEVSGGEFKLRQKSNHVTINVDLSGLAAILSGTQDYVRQNQFVLYLPKDKKISEAEFDTEDGDISIDGLKSDKMDIAVDAGDMKISDADSKDIKIASSDGDIEIKKSVFEKIDLYDSYGDLKTTDTDISNGKISDDNGDIDFVNTKLKYINITDNYGDFKCNDGLFEEVNLQLNDGDLKLHNTKLTGNIKINSGYGDVKVIGFDDWNDILVSAKTSYGDISVNHKIDGEKTETSFEKNVENPSAKLEINCSDGDISIR